MKQSFARHYVDALILYRAWIVSASCVNGYGVERYFGYRGIVYVFGLLLCDGLDYAYVLVGRSAISFNGRLLRIEAFVARARKIADRFLAFIPRYGVRPILRKIFFLYPCRVTIM